MTKVVATNFGVAYIMFFLFFLAGMNDNNHNQVYQVPLHCPIPPALLEEYDICCFFTQFCNFFFESPAGWERPDVLRKGKIFLDVTKGFAWASMEPFVKGSAAAWNSVVHPGGWWGDGKFLWQNRAAAAHHVSSNLDNWWDLRVQSGHQFLTYVKDYRLFLSDLNNVYDYMLGPNVPKDLKFRRELEMLYGVAPIISGKIGGRMVSATYDARLGSFVSRAAELTVVQRNVMVNLKQLRVVEEALTAAKIKVDKLHPEWRTPDMAWKRGQ